MAQRDKEAFYAALKAEFAPALRGLGFNGSGSNFRRIRGEIINVVNVQGNKYGGSVAVNLGLHLSFLPAPISGEPLADIEAIKAYDCEFTNRLAPGGRADHWWKYGTWLKQPARQVSHLTETYLEVGEPAFTRFDTIDKILKMVDLAAIDALDHIETFGYVSTVRAALTVARIYHHQGRHDEADAYARAGLRNIQRATVLRPAFEALLKPTPPR